MDIAVAADKEFVRHTGVMLQSLLTHNRHVDLRIYFIHDGAIPADDLSRLASVVHGGGGVLHPLVLPDAWARRLAPHPVFGIAAWYRLLLPVLLPQLPRVLYLDSDVIINGALDELWNVDLGNHLLAAVVNPLYPHQSRKWLSDIEVPEDEYFNSGVLLMNLDQLRREGWVDRFVEHIERRFDRLRYADQDVLNALLWHRCLKVPPRFNAQITLFDLGESHLPYTNDELQSARRNPTIVHFIGPMKPWRDDCGHPYRHLYWQHLAATPWRGMPPDNRAWFNAVLRHIPNYWRVLAEARARKVWRSGINFQSSVRRRLNVALARFRGD